MVGTLRVDFKRCDAQSRGPLVSLPPDCWSDFAPCG
jgi:hypothetical protein